jgi:hypothetical protein
MWMNQEAVYGHPAPPNLFMKYNRSFEVLFSEISAERESKELLRIRKAK